MIVKVGLLASLGLGAALVAFALAKPGPIPLPTVLVDSLPAGLGSPTNQLDLLAELRQGSLTVRKATAILVLSAVDSTDLQRIASVRTVVEEAQFAFSVRLGPNLRIVDPTVSLVLTAKDAPFPRTLILVEPGRPPRIAALPPSLDSLRVALSGYRRTTAFPPSAQL